MAKRRYTLSELVSRCGPDARLPKDMEDWESTAKRDEAFIGQARADSAAFQALQFRAHPQIAAYNSGYSGWRE